MLQIYVIGIVIYFQCDVIGCNDINKWSVMNLYILNSCSGYFCRGKCYYFEFKR